MEPIAAGLAAQRATPDQIRMLLEAINSPSAEEELDFHLFLADDCLRLGLIESTPNELRQTYTGMTVPLLDGLGLCVPAA